MVYTVHHSISSPGRGRPDSLSVAVTGTGSLEQMVTFDPMSETANEVHKCRNKITIRIQYGYKHINIEHQHIYSNWGLWIGEVSNAKLCFLREA